MAGYIRKHYKIGDILDCCFFAEGLNDTYKVTAALGTYYFRVYRANWRRLCDVEAETDLLEYLSGKGLQISSPVKMEDRTYVSSFNAPEGIRYAVLFTEAQGDWVDHNNRNQAYRYGQWVGQFHRLSDSSGRALPRFHLDNSHMFTEPLAHICRVFPHKAEHLQYIESIGGKLVQRLDEILERSEPYIGICHGDLHWGNVHFIGGKEPVVYDFDCWGYGSRSYDLSVFLWNMKLGNEEHADEDWDRFLKGYEDYRTLAEWEHRAIDLFVALRHIWLMGLHCHGTTHWGRTWINDAYADGQVEFIRRWVAEKNLV